MKSEDKETGREKRKRIEMKMVLPILLFNIAGWNSSISLVNKIGFGKRFS